MRRPTHISRNSSNGIFSDGLLRTVFGLLFGVYIGINLSGFYHQSFFDSQSQNQQSIDNDSKLVELKAELQNWKAKAETSEIEKSGALNRVHQLEESLEGCDVQPKSDNDPLLSPSTSNLNQHPLCQQLVYPTPSAFSLWNHNILRILNATRHPNDAKFRFHDFTAELLQMITPRLPRSVKSVPFEWDALERAMTVAWNRWEYMQLPLKQREAVDNPPRRLKILVMGGSLLVGTNCRKLLTELKIGQYMGLPKRDCNWAKRLGAFFDTYFGENVVEVDKVRFLVSSVAVSFPLFEYAY